MRVITMPGIPIECSSPFPFCLVIAQDYWTFQSCSMCDLGPHLCLCVNKVHHDMYRLDILGTYVLTAIPRGSFGL